MKLGDTGDGIGQHRCRNDGFCVQLMPVITKRHLINPHNRDMQEMTDLVTLRGIQQRLETNNIGRDEVFQYKITQADGDTANAFLTVHIGGVRYEGVGSAADTFVGANNSLDLLLGGLGNDTLTGGTGTDVFKWGASDSGADTITDFKFGSVAAGGDVLDLRDLLSNEASTGTSLDGYLNFTTVDGKLALSIDSNGAAAGGNAQTIKFDNVADVNALRSELGLSLGASEVDIINKLLSNGNLKTD